jgi:hypothetical protein
VLTTTPDSRGRRLGLVTTRRVDYTVKRYDWLYLLLLRGLKRAGTDEEANSEISSFQRQLLELVAYSTIIGADWIKQTLSEIYEIGYNQQTVIYQQNAMQIATPAVDIGDAPPEMFRSFASAEYQRLSNRISTLITNGRAAAAITSALGGISLHDALAIQALGKADAYNYRKALEETALSTLQHEMWLQGQGNFGKKIVIAEIDDRTTALCGRLDGTVWNWNEMVVDPLTGGAKMFAPFVGPQFNPPWHPCRSIVVPYKE